MPRRPPAPLVAALLLAVLLLATAFALPGSPAADAQTVCTRTGGGQPYKFQTWEDNSTRPLFREAISLAAANQLLPDDPEFHVPALELGRERRPDPAAVIPAHILFGIAWDESKLTQTANATDYGNSGPTLVSSDCGYGIMQITTGYVNDAEPPTAWEALVGSHYAYNIAAGARILADKWNDSLFPQIGLGDARFIESWYYAIWAYNGWALSNHPNGPNADLFRSPYRCDERRTGYPYQERVLGCIAHPPSRDGRQLWEPFQIQLPDWRALSYQGGPLDQNLFLSGWTEIRTSYDSGSAGAFSAMAFQLPGGALPYTDAGRAGRDLEAARDRVLGDPVLSVSADSVQLSSLSGASRQGTFLISNSGTGLLPWRIVDSPSWLRFELHAGAALGRDPNWNAPAGLRSSRLAFRTAAEGQPEGPNRGDIVIEAMLPDGSRPRHIVKVDLDKTGAAFYPAGNPQS